MRVVLLSGCLFFLTVTRAQANATTPTHSWRWYLEGGSRLAPLGLIARPNTGYYRRLFKSDSILFKDSHIAMLGLATLSPAYAFGGLRLQIEPIALFRFSVDYQAGGYFGVLNNTRSFPTSLPSMGSRELIETLDQAPTTATWAHRITLTGRLQAQYKRLAARYTLEARRHMIALPDRDKSWMNYNLEILSPARGWTMKHDTDLLLDLSKGVMLATRYTHIAAYHEDREGPIVIRRLGPAFIWQRKSKHEPRIKSHTWFALVQWPLTHPFRNGQGMNPAIPTMTLGYATGGFFQ